MNRSLKTFRATLPAEDSELDICPPDCQVDHDAKWRADAPAPRPTDDHREEGTMATAEKIVKPLSKAAVTRRVNAGEPVYKTRSGETFASILDRRAFRRQSASA